MPVSYPLSNELPTVAPLTWTVFLTLLTMHGLVEEPLARTDQELGLLLLQSMTGRPDSSHQTCPIAQQITSDAFHETTNSFVNFVTASGIEHLNALNAFNEIS